MAGGGARFSSRRVSLLLVCWLLVTVFLGWEGRVHASGLAVSTHALSYETELILGDVKIPVLSGLQDSGLEDRLNDRWNRGITGFVEGVLPQAQAFADEHDEELRHWLPFSVGVDYKVAYLDEGFVSIPIVYYSYTGGAHGFHYQESTNVNLQTGKDVIFQDLFVPGYDYSQTIEDEVLRQMQMDPLTYFDATMAESRITGDHPFYVTAQGIVVYYGLYEVAPYSSGIREFTIPFADIWEGLQPDIQALARRQVEIAP
ncbi:MAG: DUF3298 and DUF4163 domain-containing protein [Firmicutes bacterium]|nr:DUF3298 and DUF4163 domain-containing protein [Bacillota bacterium]